MCPIAGRSVYRTVRQLLSGSLQPDVTASLDGFVPHVPSLRFLRISVSCLLPRCCQNLLVFSAMLLYFAYAKAYPPLCICTSVAYLPSGTIRQVLTARCLSAAYPGIQPMVLYLCSFFPFPMSCPFANSLNVVAWCFFSFFPL